MWCILYKVHIRPTNTFSHAFPFPKQVYQVRSMSVQNDLTVPVRFSIIAIISLFVLLLFVFCCWYISTRLWLCTLFTLWYVVYNNNNNRWSSCRKWVYPYYVLRVDPRNLCKSIFSLVWLMLDFVSFSLVWFDFVWLGTRLFIYLLNCLPALVYCSAPHTILYTCFYAYVRVYTVYGHCVLYIFMNTKKHKHFSCIYEFQWHSRQNAKEHQKGVKCTHNSSQHVFSHNNNRMLKSRGENIKIQRIS